MKKEEKKLFKKNDRTKFSLAGQVLIFSILATILTALVALYVLGNNAEEKAADRRKELAGQLTEDIMTTVRGYPAYEWLLAYWYRNRDTLDVEYDANTETREKARAFCQRNPGMVIDDVLTEELEALPEDEQKIYAEIVYNRMTLLLNQLKEIYTPAYICILIANEDYTGGTFLVNGAAKDQKRGSNYEDAYVLGVTVDSTPEQESGMKAAASGEMCLVQSGDYLDAFGYIQDIEDGHVMVIVTYDISDVVEEAKGTVLNMIIIFVALQVALAVALFILIFFYAVRPVGKIQKNIWRYRETKESKPVLEDLGEITIRNELGALSADLSDMVISIDQYVDEIQDITADREKIAAELNVAKRIQAEMLPNEFPAFPDRKDFDLYATMNPAKQVGGDFYDFFMVDDNHLALVIADVSGKGVPASLFMVNSKTRIQNQAILGGTPGTILEKVNDQLSKGNESGFFVTVWLAIIDLTTGKGVSANAGHEHPVIRHANGEYELVEYHHAPMVGIMEGLSFAEREFELLPGDRIFVYTDGVPEATNAHDELFGTERMLKALNSHREDNLQDLLPHLKEDIDTFVGDAVQFDDITMLAFDYYGSEGK